MKHHSYMIEDFEFSKRQAGRLESLYSIGNGNIGFRGYHIDHKAVHQPTLFMNGFYELSPIVYGEDAYGFARWNQTMIPLPDIRVLKIKIQGQRVNLETDGVREYRRRLDFFTGIMSYSYKITLLDDLEVTISVQTLTSMKHKECGAAQITIEANKHVEIEIIQTIEYKEKEVEESDDPRKQTARIKNLKGSDYSFSKDGINGTFRTHVSDLSLFLMSQNSASSHPKLTRQTYQDDFPALVYEFYEEQLTFSTLFYYGSTKEKGKEVEKSHRDEMREFLTTHSFATFVEEQKSHYTQFWATHDVVVSGDDEIQRALRLNMFQLHQSTGTDGKTSLSAKGLTGSGYEGHYFWDTEIYGMPFFTFSSPQTARSLIQYRITILDKARMRAREMSQKGALYPWRTINGLEASAYYPAGTAQYHINADIAYSILQYIEVTSDYSILLEGAAEVLFETARLYADLGFFKDGQFHLHQVTGPDEYSAVVDNNTYTNAMVRHHFRGAHSMYTYLKKHYQKEFTHICEAISLKEGEVELWVQAANHMRFPFHKELGIHAQDERFLEKEKWDIKKKGNIKHPMLLHYHPLVIYRHQIIKQADTVLAMFLLSQDFPLYEIKRNFDYYRPLTTGDSSLSACVEGIVAFQCGYVELGLEYLKTTILMDLFDLHHNTSEGLHTAAMGGSWMAIVYGIAGFRFIHGEAHFSPKLPRSIDKISFTLNIYNKPLKVKISKEQTSYQYDGHLNVYHHSTHLEVIDEITVKTDAQIKSVIFDLDGVITSTDEYHYRAWKRLSDEMNWEFDRELNQQLRGISREASLQVILDYNNTSLTQEEVGLLTDKKNAWYKESLYSLSEKDILPGIKELLIDLQRRGITTAVASASKNATFILERLELTTLFTHIVDARDVIKGKPDPEVFIRAALALGVLPCECVGVEDAPSGIVAIKSAMMKSVGVGDAVDAAMCDVHVKDTSTLTREVLLSPQ